MKHKYTNEVQQELEGISLLLSQLPKQELHTDVPQDYFNEVEDLIVRQMSLAQHDKTEQWQTPKGYFDQLENSILETIKPVWPNKTKPGKIVPFYRFRLKYLAAAAASVVFISACWWLFSLYVHQNGVEDMALENNDMYLQYVEDHIDDIDINMLIDADLIQEEDVTLVSVAEDAVPTNEEYSIEDSEINF